MELSAGPGVLLFYAGWEGEYGKSADCILGLKHIPVVILINFLLSLLLSSYLSHLLIPPTPTPTLSISISHVFCDQTRHLCVHGGVCR